MNTNNIRTPGMYIEERNAFAHSVVPVATAVPAFIGYTPQAEYKGESFTNKAKKISSLAEFNAIYTLPPPDPPKPAPKQYKPIYYLVPQAEKPSQGCYIPINKKFYSILPDSGSIYYLYNSIRLFYLNGGREAYIVSVGSYGEPNGKPLDSPTEPLVNKNVSLEALSQGLALLKNYEEPTMYICPEATLLTVDENSTVMQRMLQQADDMQTTMCLFDVIGSRHPDPILYSDAIAQFREKTGTMGLKYGAAYYPFVGTTITPKTEVDYTQLFGGAVKELEPLLNPPENPNEVAGKVLDKIQNPSNPPLSLEKNNEALLNASPIYEQIMDRVLNEINLLPPSGGMAGVYTLNDADGVWNTPANRSIAGVTSLPIQLSNKQQEAFNVDAVSGKSINTIRLFNGVGILIWGGRTLDGNSRDWQYVSARRTVNFIEQAVKLFIKAYVFELNNAHTWSAIRGSISNFLTDVWKNGGLQGAHPMDAFEVNIGLGNTMTPEDLLNGFLKITVRIAVVRPAEFIEITFQQQMPTSA